MGVEPVDHLLPVPDCILVGAGENRNGLPGLAVRRQGSMGMLVSPQDVGQDAGVSCIGLGRETFRRSR
jgi:hypothetical protein